VSSIIAAREDGHGIVGVAPEAKVMSVRIFDDWTAPAHRLVRGIRWAVKHHADVINLSLVERNLPALRSAVRAATRHGIVVVAGAGNDRQSGSPVHYPAAYPGVIAVGAVRADLALAGYSNEGGYVDVVAPGSRVLGSDPFGTLSWYWGTSFATPQVSGVVALMLSANPRLTPAEVQRILRSTADDLGAPGKDRLYGAGLVDARAAVRAARALAH
jgi:subtilisin family serine protease